MSLDSVTEKITRKLARASALNAKVKIDFGDEGKVIVDATQNPPVISNDDADADVTLVCSVDTFEGILSGTQDPNVAFLMGKLKIQGSMGLAMKLNAMLED
jgi:putative sterol carrier protein